MALLSSTIRGPRDPFATTHWSVVLTAAHGSDHPGQAEAALAELCRSYWAPLYTFARRRGYEQHDAQDLTQGFLAHLIEHRIYDRAGPEKGKFRAYLLAAMKNFLANARARDHALKRGGRRLALPLVEAHTQAAESFYQARQSARNPAVDADRSFELSWAQAVVDAAMQRVAAGYLAAGKPALFAALRPFIAGDADALPGYEEAAAALGIPASTVRSYVTRLRTRYREALCAEVRRTVPADADVEDELRALLRALAGR